MDKIFNLTSLVVGVIGGCFAQLFGGFDTLISALALLVVLDYATGIIKAAYLKELSSEIGFKGILKKMTMFIVIATACIIQRIIGDSIPLRDIVIMFFVCNEALSLLENAAVMIPIPKKLKDVLLQLRDKSEIGEKENEKSN